MASQPQLSPNLLSHVRLYRKWRQELENPDYNPIGCDVVKDRTSIGFDIDWYVIWRYGMFNIIEKNPNEPIHKCRLMFYDAWVVDKRLNPSRHWIGTAQIKLSNVEYGNKDIVIAKIRELAQANKFHLHSPDTIIDIRSEEQKAEDDRNTIAFS